MGIPERFRRRVKVWIEFGILPVYNNSDYDVPQQISVLKPAPFLKITLIFLRVLSELQNVDRLNRANGRQKRFSKSFSTKSLSISFYVWIFLNSHFHLSLQFDKFNSQRKRNLHVKLIIKIAFIEKNWENFVDLFSRKWR